MNHSGRSGLAARTDTLAGALLALLLAACAGPPPAAPEPTQYPVSQPEVQERVRDPASREAQGVQVYPVQNPAVKQLIGNAREAEAAGRYDDAAVSIERALRIHPRDPELLQLMAEILLQKQDYAQALNFATRPYDAGPRVGELCSRNWRTMGVAHERLGDNAAARRANQRAGDCMSAKPPGY